MTETRIIVPMGELDWLEEELVPLADAEGPEEEGGVQVFYVADQTPAAVKDLLANLLDKTGTQKEYRIEIDGDQVKVLPVKAPQWLKYSLGGSTAYDKALKKKVKEVSGDPGWAAWWAETPYSTLHFHVSDEGTTWHFLPVEAEDTGSLLVEARFPEQEREMVDQHLTEILTRTGEWLKIPVPNA